MIVQFAQYMKHTNPILSNIKHVSIDDRSLEHQTSAGIATPKHFRWKLQYSLSSHGDFQALINIALEAILRGTSKKLTGELLAMYPHIVIDDPVATTITQSEYQNNELHLIMHPEHSRRVLTNSDLAIFDLYSNVPTYLGVPFSDSEDIERIVGFNNALSCVANFDVSIVYKRNPSDNVNLVYDFTIDIRGLFLMVNILGETS